MTTMLPLDGVPLVEKSCPNCGSAMVQRHRPSRRHPGKLKLGGWTCNPCASAQNAKYLADNPDKRIDVRLWTLYRIRLSDYRRMLEEQDHRCAACGKHADDCDGSHAWSKLVVDHDHSCCNSRPLCGKCVRGLICGGCNVALGHAGEDVERLRKLIAYLEKYQ